MLVRTVRLRTGEAEPTFLAGSVRDLEMRPVAERADIAVQFEPQLPQPAANRAAASDVVRHPLVSMIVNAYDRVAPG